MIKWIINVKASILLLWMAFLIVISIIMQSTLFCRICAGFLFFICLVLGKREKTLINPYYLFSLTPLTLLCYISLGGHYMLELSVRTWILCLINIYAFIFALYHTKSFSIERNCISISNRKTLILHIVVLLLLSLLSLLIPPLESILWLFGIAAIVCAFKLKNKFILFLFLIYIVVLMKSGNLSKMDVLLYLLTIVLSYIKYYGITSKDKIKVIVVGVLGVGIMLYSFTFATKGEGKRDQEETLVNYLSYGDFEWNYSAALFLPYMYLETPWTNVEFDLKENRTRSYGLWMIKPLLGYLGLDESFKKQYTLTPYSAFNTMSFIPVGYHDFGYWFSFLSPLFLGFYVKKVYSRFLISRSPFDVACYVAVALATVEMFFSNHFFMISYPFTVFIIMELYKKIAIALGNTKVELE